MIKYIKSLFKRKETDLWQKAIDAHEQLSKGWHQSAQAAQLVRQETQLVFKAANGSCYYSYVDPINMPMERRVALTRALNDMELGAADGDFMDAWSDEVIKLTETGQIDSLRRIKNMMLVLKERMAMPPTEKMLLCIGTYYLLRHDENPYENSPISTATKLDELANDPNLRAFFLHIALELAKVTMGEYMDLWSIKSSDSFLIFLEQQRMKQAEKSLSQS